MKVLVTGATGFIGKKTLALLVESDLFEEIIVITRSKKTHPSKKVSVVKGDLTDPQCLRNLNKEVDSVIHIAGLYDFTKGYTDNYLHNVVATSQVIAWIKELPKPATLHFISTYAVGAGRWSSHQPEQLQSPLPPENRYYAYSKSLAEVSVAKSGLPFIIYRPGIVVGDSITGQFENLNGPYYILKTMSDLNKLGILKRLPTFPIPGKQNAYLPIAPVDMVAEVIVDGVKRQDELAGGIYGIYEQNSIRAVDFIKAVKEHWGLSFQPVFINEFPEQILEMQSKLTRIPPEVFRFAGEVQSLDNARFRKDFKEHLIPPFEEYKDVFFAGFEKMNGKF